MAINEGIIKWNLSTASYTYNAIGTLVGGRDREKCGVDVASRIWLSWPGTKDDKSGHPRKARQSPAYF